LGMWLPSIPEGYLTTSAAAERKGLSVSRIQHLCRAYAQRIETAQRQRLEHAGVDQSTIAELMSRGPSVPPQDPQRDRELQCTWNGNGRRREYFINALALASLATNALDPVTGRQPRRGHRAGWRPEQDYRRADDATDLRHAQNAPLLAARALLAERGLEKLYEQLKVQGVLRVALASRAAPIPESPGRLLADLSAGTLLGDLATYAKVRLLTRDQLRRPDRAE